MRWTALLVVMSLLAGCSDDAEPQETTTTRLAGEPVGGGSGEEAPPEDVANYTAQRYEGGANLLVSKADTGTITFSFNNQNCALIPDRFTEITNLTAAATWTSEVGAELVLFVRGESSRSVGPGPSPLELDLDALGPGLVRVGLDAAPVAFNEEVLLSLSFDYVGAEGLVLEPGYSC